MHARFFCDCGKTQWSIADASPATVMPIVCHCRDCQAWAHHLGRADRMMDGSGGTRVFLISPHRLTISRGLDNIRPVRLSPNGLFRWQATCCGTPVANTTPDPRISFATLAAYPAQDAGGEHSIAARINTQGATRPVRKFGLWRVLLRAFVQLGWSRLSGRWRRTPLFDAATGKPVAAPHVIARAERDAAYAAADAAR